VIDLTDLLKRSLHSKVRPVKAGKVSTTRRSANDEGRAAAAAKPSAKAKTAVKPPARRRA